MKTGTWIRWVPTMLAIGLAGMAAAPHGRPHGRASAPTLDRMPAELEARYALSAAPPALRDRATVYLLDPAHGYRLSRQGTNGVACLVERTAWELADLRDDLYVPLCYDAAGATTYLRVIMDAAALRARGMGADALKAEIARRYGDRTYRAPTRTGVSYMVAPVIRTVGPPDLRVRTMAMPHLMFYAPHLTDADIAAAPDLADPTTLLHPFVMVEGTAEQSYMILLTGEAEKARIVADGRALLDALCAYRDLLCLTPATH